MGALDTSAKKASIRFTCQASKTLSAFRVYIHNNESGSKSYRYGVQADAAGLPSGAWLAYRDLTVSGSSGWLTVTLTSGIALTASQVYHIVVQPVDSPSKTVALRATSPLNSMIVYDQAPDASSNTLFYDGAAWTTQGYQPVYLLAYSDNSYEGNPCSAASYGSVYGSIWESELFTMSGAGCTIIEVAVYLKREGMPPNDCSVVLYNNTDLVEVASGVIARASEVTTSYAWYTYRLPDPKTLTAGKQYRFYLKTTGGSATNRYMWCMPYNYDAAAYNSRNYGGLGSINQTSSDGGLSWADGWPNYDAVFRFTIYSLAITVDPASVGLGMVVPGASDVVSQSTRPGGELLVTNSGSERLRYQLGLDNPPVWTAVDGPPAAPNQYRLAGLFHTDQAVGPDFDKAGPGFADVIGTAPKTCDGAIFATGSNQDGYDVSPDDTQSLYFSFDAPPSTGVTSEQAITITVTAQPMP
jgi:hypothetical protein